MKFSIRGILIATFLIALGVLVWTSKNAIQLTNEKISHLKARRTQEAARVASTKPLQISGKAEWDHLHNITTLVSELQAAYLPLQQKYGTIEPKDEKTLSIVRFPMLCDPKTGSDPVRLRLLVPDGRTVFLNFAIGLLEVGVNEQEKGFRMDERDVYKWLTKTPYARSGPYELRLDSGDNFLEWSFDKGNSRFRLSLNDEPLLSTELLEMQNTGFSYGNLVFDFGGPYGIPSRSVHQLNFAQTDRLPKILEFEHPSTETGLGIGSIAKSRTQGTEVTDAAKQSVVHQRARVWLDDKSSGFEAFPRVGN